MSESVVSIHFLCSRGRRGGNWHFWKVPSFQDHDVEVHLPGSSLGRTHRDTTRFHDVLSGFHETCSGVLESARDFEFVAL